MNATQAKTLLVTKLVAASGWIIGFLLFISSFFASAATHDYLMSIGIGVMVAFLFIFGFGMFLATLESAGRRRA